MNEAWVVYSGKADLFYLRVLKKGFRHCSILLNDGKQWIEIDPLSNYTDVTVHAVPLEFDLPDYLRGQGHVVQNTEIHRPETKGPTMPMTCVEVVKKHLGIHARWVLTPNQLYKHLEKQHG